LVNGKISKIPLSLPLFKKFQKSLSLSLPLSLSLNGKISKILKIFDVKKK